MRIKTRFYKKIKFFLRKNFSETVSLTTALVGSSLAFYFAQNSNLQFLSSLVLAITFYLIVLFTKHISRGFYNIEFSDERDIKNWIGNGKFVYYPKGKAFLIKDSEAGFLFSECFGWVNYELSCEFKIQNQCLGVIFRAIDLSNYVMLQITKDGIRPHIRVNGGWIAKEAKESNLLYEKDLIDGEWYKLTINLKGDTVNIIILDKDKRTLIDKNWDILSGKVSLKVRSESDDARTIGIFDTNVNFVYGTCGFRNNHAEQALVKNLTIEKS